MSRIILRCTDHRLGTILRRSLLTLAFLGLISTFAAAEGSLWLYPEGATSAGGHVVTEPSFTLDISNRGHGNGDNTAYGTTLIVSANDPTLMTGATLTMADGTVITIDPAAMEHGTPTLPCSGRDLPRHGIFPAYYTEVTIGDLAAGQVVPVEVEVDGASGLAVHFDATATGVKTRHDVTECTDLFTPFGHDVSQVFGEPGGDDCALEIEKTGDATAVDIDGTVTFAIDVTNTGSCTISTFVVADNIPTLLDENGDPVPAFSVASVDPAPASQSETAITWEGGPLDPGETATFTVVATFDQPLADGHTVRNQACVSATELRHAQCARAAVDVGDVLSGDGIGGPGFWCHSIRFALERPDKARISADDLQSWLDMIDDQSNVFSELKDVSTLDLAEPVLCRPNLQETAADKLERQLLALWLNLASERVGPDVALGELCAGSEALPADAYPTWTVADVIAGAEADLLADADASTLLFWKDVIDFVNNASAGPCTEVAPVRGQARHVSRARGRGHGH
ncbi:MAG: choice-of-anchor N protein [Acidobacteria bacterium]|nr:choice-of-anchor N protein [Acidobacteriota bacterium]